MTRIISVPVFLVSAASCLWGIYAETTRSPAFWADRAMQASLRDDYAAMLEAARTEVRIDPGSAAAWQRRAYAATLAAGGPTKEALAALDAAYRQAPFPEPEQMIWRVDFADAYWSGLPDPLTAATLLQIEALGRMGEHWDPRVRWCRGAGTDAIAAAACATVPGVAQGVDRP